MDPAAFGIVKGEVQRLTFKDDKVNAISFAQGHFYAEQVAQLMKMFSFDDGRLKGLQACVGKMLPVTCVAIIPILKAFSFDKNKVSALELIAVQITDPLNFHAFNEVFPYINERDRVRNIMQKRATMGPPQPPVINPALAGNPYPYGKPRPSVDPDDSLYKAADRAFTGAVNVVEGAASMLFGRPQQRGVVVQRPATVSYQTTTSYVTPPGTGVQVVHLPPGASVATITPSAPYPRQPYVAGSYPVGQMPPPYQPHGGYPTQPQWK
ncbi:PREDICTED: proline and serine-rich protein 1-like [Acropora digitifera]|uniref:proline and serine-rich protein 1-like n=1 Tax=Acropora digitifera TaxID=70779 RepID=UPI00077AF794|nr:PREDICTED: proline and serine-rich protein 1-like [Acropora digitifera]